MNKSLCGIALLLVFLVFLASGSALAAQTVGSLPDKSPYLDVNDGQRFGLVAGYLLTGKDPVGVGPKSAPMLGLRYDIAIGGPAYFTGTIFGARTTRTILDYTRSRATRNIGTQSAGLIDANVAVALSLTGARTWHRIQPLVNVGVGFVTGVGDKADVSGYKMRTGFSVSSGFGVRFVTGKNSELRADANVYWWSIKYPELYRSTQGDPVAIRPTGALSVYTMNGAFTLGWSLRSFR